MAVQNAIDDILYAEENIIKLNNKIAEVDDRNKKIDGMIRKIDELKNEIFLTFMRTQNLIISSYFDKKLDKIYDIQELGNYRKKLYTFKDYLGSAEGFSFFNDYYVNKMEQLEERYNALEYGTIETSLKIISRKESKLIKFLKAIKKLIFGTSTNIETAENRQNL